MSEQSSEQGAEPSEDDGPTSVSESELPEDLRRGNDNPLAEPVDEDVPADILKDTTPSGSTGTSDEDTGEDTGEDPDGED
jgi:hypothetical protein